MYHDYFSRKHKPMKKRIQFYRTQRHYSRYSSKYDERRF